MARVSSCSEENRAIPGLESSRVVHHVTVELELHAKLLASNVLLVLNEHMCCQHCFHFVRVVLFTMSTFPDFFQFPQHHRTTSTFLKG